MTHTQPQRPESLLALSPNPDATLRCESPAVETDGANGWLSCGTDTQGLKDFNGNLKLGVVDPMVVLKSEVKLCLQQ